MKIHSLPLVIHHKTSSISRFLTGYFHQKEWVLVSSKGNDLCVKERKIPSRQTILKIILIFTIVVPLIASIFLLINHCKWKKCHITVLKKEQKKPIEKPALKAPEVKVEKLPKKETSFSELISLAKQGLEPDTDIERISVNLSEVTVGNHHFLFQFRSIASLSFFNAPSEEFLSYLITNKQLYPFLQLIKYSLPSLIAILKTAAALEVSPHADVLPIQLGYNEILRHILTTHNLSKISDDELFDLALHQEGYWRYRIKESTLNLHHVSNLPSQLSLFFDHLPKILDNVDCDDFVFILFYLFNNQAKELIESSPANLLKHIQKLYIIVKNLIKDSPQKALFDSLYTTVLIQFVQLPEGLFSLSEQEKSQFYLEITTSPFYDKIWPLSMNNSEPVQDLKNALCQGIFHIAISPAIRIKFLSLFCQTMSGHIINNLDLQKIKQIHQEYLSVENFEAPNLEWNTFPPNARAHYMLISALQKICGRATPRNKLLQYISLFNAVKDPSLNLMEFDEDDLYDFQCLLETFEQFYHEGKIDPLIHHVKTNAQGQGKLAYFGKYLGNWLTSQQLIPLLALTDNNAMLSPLAFHLLCSVVENRSLEDNKLFVPEYFSHYADHPYSIIRYNFDRLLKRIKNKAIYHLISDCVNGLLDADLREGLIKQLEAFRIKHHF